MLKVLHNQNIMRTFALSKVKQFKTDYDYG